MSAPTTKTSDFETIDIGSDTSAITVSILKFPRADGSLLDKVQAFSYFDDVINQHRAQLTSTAIQQAYVAVTVESPPVRRIGGSGAKKN
jgi:hypothetical protein